METTQRSSKTSAPNRVRIFLWVGALASLAGAVAVYHIVQNLAHDRRPARPDMRIVGPGRLELQKDSAFWKYLQLADAEALPALGPLPVPGRVSFDPARAAALGARLPGKVEQVLVGLGDQVRKGQRLVSVRSGSLADLDRDVENAHNLVAVKTRLAERARELFDLKVISEREKLGAEAEQREAELSYRAASSRKASLEVAEEGGNLYWLIAPRDGTVVELGAIPGLEVFPEMPEPLIRLAELSEVLVFADVQEQEVADIHDSERATIIVRRQTQPVEGTVEKVSSVIDPERRTVQVRIRVDNRTIGLRPNAYVQVTFAAAKDATHVRVPSDAVVTDGGQNVVFVVDGEHLNRTVVRIGRERDGETEILDGLSPGLRYVAKGSLFLLNEIDLSK